MSAPQTSTLPTYILNRNAAAAKAGLQMVRMTESNGFLHSAFEGTPEQFVAAGFVAEADNFVRVVNNGKKSFAAYRIRGRIWSPFLVQPCFYRAAVDGQIRMTIGKEPVPVRWWHHSPSIEAFECTSPQHCVAYVAKSRAELDAAGLLPSSEYAQNGYPACGDRPACEPSWWGLRGHDDVYHAIANLESEDDLGVVSLVVYPAELRWADTMRKHAKKWPYTSDGQYLEILQKAIEYADCILGRPHFSQDGNIYRLDDFSESEMRRLVSELEFTLEHAKVVRTEDPEHRAFQAMRASGDQGFQALMQSVLSERKVGRKKKSAGQGTAQSH